MEGKGGKAMSNNLDTLVTSINKKYGDWTIRSAGEYPILRRISTGIFALDAGIGGGVPKGRICIFAGNESAGKTTVAKLTMAQFQNTCKGCLLPLNDCTCENKEPHKAVFIDMEGAFDAQWFKTLGGNVEDLLLIQPEFAEQAVDIAEALIRSSEVDILVVDSIAMLSPADEIEKSSEDLLVGTHARLMNRMMRSIQSGMNSLGMSTQRKPSVILINQIRSKIGVMFGDTTTYPGGLGQKFASSITVRFTARPSERIYKDTTKKEDLVAVQIRFHVEKNKTFTPHQNGMFTLYVNNSDHGEKGAVNNEDQVVAYATKYGVIEKSGAWLNYKGEKYQGKTHLVDALIDDVELLEELKMYTLEKVKGVVTGVEEDNDEE